MKQAYVIVNNDSTKIEQIVYYKTAYVPNNCTLVYFDNKVLYDFKFKEAIIDNSLNFNLEIDNKYVSIDKCYYPWAFDSKLGYLPGDKVKYISFKS